MSESNKSTCNHSGVTRPAEKHALPPLDEMSPLKNFLHRDMVGPGLLLLCAGMGLFMANSAYAEPYHRFWEMEWGVTIGTFHFDKSLHRWINDGLMSIFFFMVGLEIKRELSIGELAQLRKALLPIMAAVGGMLVPAGIYSLFNIKGAGSSGWGIPMATDIAFAAGCIAVLRKWVPPALMVFLIALAIVDDLGAVLVIALFYTEQIAMTPLLIGGTLIVISLCMGRLGVRISGPYVVIGMIIWLAFLESGIHATIAGVLLAFSIPVTARYRTQNFKGRMEELLSRFKQAETLWEVDRHGRPLNLQKDHMVNQRQQTLIRHMNWECHHVEAPLQRIEQTLEPFCVFLIMPLFAFANAGVHFEMSHGAGQLLHPVTLGIVAGLVLGKPLGIMLASLVSVKAGWAVLPRNVNWGQLAGVGVLAGIGFTMSLFINGLAFQGLDPQVAASLIAAGKIGIFIASILAAVIGLGLLKLNCVRKQ